MTHAVILQ